MSATEDLAKLEVFPRRSSPGSGRTDTRSTPVVLAEVRAEEGSSDSRPRPGWRSDRCRRRGHGQPHPARPAGRLRRAQPRDCVGRGSAESHGRWPFSRDPKRGPGRARSAAPAATNATFPRPGDISKPLRERGKRIVRGLSTGWLLFRATRAPFRARPSRGAARLAVAARAGFFIRRRAESPSWPPASSIRAQRRQRRFDTMQGADDANATADQVQRRTRVLQNGSSPCRGMSLLALSCYLLAGALGLALFAMRGSRHWFVHLGCRPIHQPGLHHAAVQLVYRGPGRDCHRDRVRASDASRRLCRPDARPPYPGRHSWRLVPVGAASVALIAST